MRRGVRQWGRDAGTDVIAWGVAAQLGSAGLRPHIVSCHIHRRSLLLNNLE